MTNIYSFHVMFKTYLSTKAIFSRHLYFFNTLIHPLIWLDFSHVIFKSNDGKIN